MQNNLLLDLLADGELVEIITFNLSDVVNLLFRIQDHKSIMADNFSCTSSHCVQCEFVVGPCSP